MGIVYEINKDLGTTFVVWDGVVAAPVFLAHVNLLSSDPNWPTPERRHIADLRSASLDDSMDQAVMEKAAAIYAAQRYKITNLKVAVLAHHEFDKAVAFERLLNRYGADVIVFYNSGTAYKWMGMDVVQAESILERIRTAGRLRTS